VSAPPVSAALAPRRARLLAFGVDCAIGVLLPVLISIPTRLLYRRMWLPATAAAAMAVLAVLAYAGCTVYFLYRDGQNIPKKLTGIKMVKTDGSRAPLWKLLLLRSGPYFAASLFVLSVRYIPFISETAAFLLLFCFTVDHLFIFRKDRRTLHDFLAGTVVVNK